MKKGITIELDTEKLAKRLAEKVEDAVYEIVDERIEQYIDENIDTIGWKSEKAAIQDQLIDADGLVKLLDIDKSEAEKIIGTVRERIEYWGDIALSDKVPKSKVFELLELKQDLPNFIL